VDPWGLAATTRAIERQAVAAATGRLTRRFDARHHDPYLQALRSYTGSFATFFRQAAEGLFAVAHLAVPRDRNAKHLLRQRFKRELHGIFLSLVNLNDVLERLPAMQAEYRARFGDRVDSQELADLEQRERLLLDAAWSAWTCPALRVPVSALSVASSCSPIPPGGYGEIIGRSSWRNQDVSLKTLLYRLFSPPWLISCLDTPLGRVYAFGMSTELTISGMTCGHCQTAVTKALKSVAGVKDAQVDLQAGKAVVDGQVDPQALLAAVTEEGYGAQLR